LTDLDPDLERELTRLEDLHEIRNLMGRRAYLHSAGLNDRELTECWSHRADVCFEAEDWGAWDGYEHIWSSYVETNPFPGTTVGLMVEHTLTTGVIEVAADGQTAKGVWLSPGHETMPSPGAGDNPIAQWSWGRYGVDFVKERDLWKIWHLHVYTGFRTPYDTDWIQSSIRRPEHAPVEGVVLPGITPTDRPPTFNQPYKINAVQVLQPVPPLPYSTWADTSSYTDRSTASAPAFGGAA
jgi:hypothetical protein